MRLVVCLSLILLARGAREFVLDTQAGTALGLGLLLIVGYFAGDTLERLRLPRLTGYLLTGLALGPYALGLVEGELGNLRLVNGTAIALIAMTAGSELDLDALRPLARSILAIVTCGVILAVAAITAAAAASRPLFGFLADLPASDAMIACVMLGVVLAAQSPSVIVALAKETSARGPLSDTVLGAVVVGDLLVILLFAVVQAVAGVTMGGASAPNATALHFAWHVVGSLAIGAAAGAALGGWLRRAPRSAPILVLGACFVLAEVGLRLGLDIIVVAVVAGALIRNRIPSAAVNLERGLTATAAPMYVLFFAVAGASLHLDVLATLGIPAVMIVLARAAGMLTGARIGARVTRTDPLVRRWAGIGLLPQAGLALALALVIGEAFPSLASTVGALALGVVAINELVAPAIWRAVLVRSGEAQRAAPADGAPLVGERLP